MMTREVVLDANVIVGLLDSRDVLHDRANTLLLRLKAERAISVLLDFLVAEALSVICRRATQRRTSPPDLARVVGQHISLWFEQGEITPAPSEATDFIGTCEIAVSSDGLLNFNDARLVLLQRRGVIGPVTSFDESLCAVENFVSVS